MEKKKLILVIAIVGLLIVIVALVVVVIVFRGNIATLISGGDVDDDDDDDVVDFINDWDGYQCTNKGTAIDPYYDSVWQKNFWYDVISDSSTRDCSIKCLDDEYGRCTAYDFNSETKECRVWKVPIVPVQTGDNSWVCRGRSILTPLGEYTHHSDNICSSSSSAYMFALDQLTDDNLERIDACTATGSPGSVEPTRCFDIGKYQTEDDIEGMQTVCDRYAECDGVVRTYNSAGGNWTWKFLKNYYVAGDGVCTDESGTQSYMKKSKEGTPATDTPYPGERKFIVAGAPGGDAVFNGEYIACTQASCSGLVGSTDRTITEDAQGFLVLSGKNIFRNASNGYVWSWNPLNERWHMFTAANATDMKNWNTGYAGRMLENTEHTYSNAYLDLPNEGICSSGCTLTVENCCPYRINKYS